MRILDKLIRDFMFHRPQTAAQDKDTNIGTIYSGPQAGLAPLGNLSGDTTKPRNFLANIHMPYKDSTSGPFEFPVFFCRTTPVGDASYAGYPIGTIAIHTSVSALARTDAALYIKTGAGYEKLMLQNDADFFDSITVTSLATAGAGTYTAAHMKGGVILRDPAGAARTDTTSTAALLVAAIPAAAVGGAVRFQVRNDSDAVGELITLAGGTGCTLNPTDIVIKPGETKELLAILTNVTASSEAYTLYDFDTIRDFVRSYSVTDATAGANTWTALEMMAGLLLRDPAGADRSDVTPTAALLVAAYPGVRVGSTFHTDITNTADADEVVTLTAGSGVTLLPSLITIGRGETVRIITTFTNVTAASEAVTMYAAKIGYTDITARVFTKKTTVTAGGGGAITITAAQLLGGYLQNDPGGGAVNATTATATQIVAAIPNCQVGSSFLFVLENTADGAEIMTLVGGTDVTLTSGHTFTPTQNESLLCLFVVTDVGSPAVTVYGLGEFTT